MKANIKAASLNKASPPTDYLALIKSRLMPLVLISACRGFFTSANQESSLASLFCALAGVYCVREGVNLLNQ
ncbi:MAG: hypothetical protein ACJ0BT_03115 [Pseudohongiellaceae bacterium]